MSVSSTGSFKTRPTVTIVTTTVLTAVIITGGVIGYQSSYANRSQTTGKTAQNFSSNSNFTNTGELTHKPLLITPEPAVAITVDGVNVTPNKSSDGHTTEFSSSSNQGGTSRTVRTYSNNTDGQTSIGINIQSESSGGSSMSSSTSVDVSSSTNSEVRRE